ncbi:prenyltransferase/squalene oxidase repeat-containing protein [Paludisphaera borealis]|uniref:Squalene cyclase C-terminal domain-containing protein n=1 Tax=Paludisphaera borealis TaxID=1387353 RepID=A0A1U7CXG7_9BACT|nr:prenyltransferase/squalene oxidase repeat-containing protein [Paludisphaera borealis]APW63625.1 hypothetical protein BSF38_05199 [Paludisphaera borealis]
MTDGLDLESFLLLLRADLGAWAFLGLVSLLLAILVWVSWGSRKALRKCLALSIAAHAGLLVGGTSMPAVMKALHPTPIDAESEPHIRRIKVSPSPSDASTRSGGAESTASVGDASRPAVVGPVDRLEEPVVLAMQRLPTSRPDQEASTVRAPLPESQPQPPLAIDEATPDAPLPPTSAEPETRSATSPPLSAAAPASALNVSGDETLKAPDVPPPPRSKDDASTTPRVAASLLPDSRLRPPSPHARPATPRPSENAKESARPVPLAMTTLRPAPPDRSTPVLADLLGATGRPTITEVPKIYRSRLDADRSARAERSGASNASEQAVERALDWLARHQDADGRWDGGTARYDDGVVVEGDDDFTVHCPAGQTCFGECAYWEADTGLTGLALLTYLGAGYTHKDGKYATTVSKGLDFLLSQQKPDGDLRGASRTVGMYCHAMATLALCEAYALSLDDKLLSGAERAIGFLARSRARDGLAWRYAPGAGVGDTSILGWVVMALKSAKEIGIPIANQASLEKGAALWLDKVASGDAKGLGRYQPWDDVTPTMTAEAWACRQFLGLGGPGPSSAEAAAYLLKHESDKGDTNVYYWYYATLAMYQHGGQPWKQWNDRVRNRLVGLQRKSGHQAGSWDPDASVYGERGGRIYCTTLAALSLEVYYRYLRLYDKPSLDHDAEDDAPALEAPPAGSPRP